MNAHLAVYAIRVTQDRFLWLEAVVEARHKPVTSQILTTVQKKQLPIGAVCLKVMFHYLTSPAEFKQPCYAQRQID